MKMLKVATIRNFATAFLALCTLFSASAATLLAAPTAPAAYAIAEINVTNPVMYRQYIAAVTPIVEHFGGKYIVRAGQIVPIEGKAPADRFVVIEFPNLAIARQFETSPQYRAIAPLRLHAAQSRIFLVEGEPR